MTHLKRGLRIVWTVAAKDIADALRNRTAIAIMMGVAMVMVTGFILPLLARSSDEPVFVIRSERRTDVVRALTRREDVRVRLVATEDELRAAITENVVTALGFALPTDLEGGQPVTLDAYVAHWVGQEQRDSLQAAGERILGEVLDTEVQMQVDAAGLYPNVDSGGQLFMYSLTFLLVLLSISGAVVPLLFIEEREAHTIDVLRVSPASSAQIVIGKAAAGMFFGAVAAAILLSFVLAFVVNWGLAIAVALMATLLSVGLGLFLGSVSNNAQTTSLWFGAALVVLLGPLYLETIAPPESGLLAAIVTWFPTTLLARGLRGAFALAVPGDVWLGLGVVVVWCLPVYAGLAWRTSLLDR